MKMFLWVSFWREIRKQLFHRNKDFILDYTVNREFNKSNSNMQLILYFHIKTSDFCLSLRWGKCPMDILLLLKWTEPCPLDTECAFAQTFPVIWSHFRSKQNDEQKCFWFTFLRFCVDGVLLWLLSFGFSGALKISYYIQRGLDNATIQVLCLCRG